MARFAIIAFVLIFIAQIANYLRAETHQRGGVLFWVSMIPRVVITGYAMIVFNANWSDRLMLKDTPIFSVSMAVMTVFFLADGVYAFSRTDDGARRPVLWAHIAFTAIITVLIMVLERVTLGFIFLFYAQAVFPSLLYLLQDEANT